MALSLKKHIRGKSSFIFVGIVLFALGVYLGGLIHPLEATAPGVTNKEPEITTSADFGPFWKVWSLIDAKYPNAKEVSDQDRVWGAIKGLVASVGDPYSVFFDPNETKNFEATITGEFSGIGIEIGMKDNVLTVIAPLKDTPAEKAGLRPGDKILKIDSTITSELSVDQAVDLIRGKEGTEVKLTILSKDDDQPKEITLVRSPITIPTLHEELREDGVYVISLYNFSAQADASFKKAILNFDRSNADKLILDLRGNPGGYLNAAISIGSWFVPKGETIVIERLSDMDKDTIYRSHGYTLAKKDFSFVILVDGGSASASEILAGALQEHKLATLVGETTYGKGSVQEVIPVTDDTELKITIAKWYTPNGISISEHGLTPDVAVNRTISDIKAGKDPQFDKALEIVKK